MAQDPSRTERATPKRREQARDEGSVLKVTDLDATLMLWTNLFLFMGVWGGAFTLLRSQLTHFLRLAGRGGLDAAGLGALGADLLSVIVRIILPFLGVNFVVALLNQVAQHGWHISGNAIKPKFTRLNPVAGFQRLFNARALVEVLKSVLKLGILAWVAYSVLDTRLAHFMGALKLPLSQSLQFLQESLFVLYRNILIAMLFLVLPDYLYQRFQFEKGMRMTKQEIKDESKDAEGNPQIKGRQKTIMFQTMMRRIQTSVPKATVVITNPTHFAVALLYDPEKAAPVCVAKGVDHLALQIRKIAKEHNVVVVENPPLARGLYWSVDLDEPIPPELYQAVAQVLAYVYRLKGAA